MHNPSGLRPASRVLVIGLDGATYDLLVPLAQQGVMPNIAQLLRDAHLSTLRSTAPCITPAAWTTFQTGVDPLAHGILDYRYYDHRRRAVLLNSTERLDLPTVFDCVAADGSGVVSLGLPMTWPPANRPGIVVGGVDSPSAQASLARHPRFARQLRRAGIVLDFDLIWHRKPADFDELRAHTAKTSTSFRTQCQMAMIADRLCAWRLMVVQFQTLDALLHRCWHLLALDAVGPASPSQWTREVYKSLGVLDRAVGELLELADRRGAVGMVVSDHGFGPFREKISIRELLRRRGLLVPASVGNRLAYRAARATWKLKRSLLKASRRGWPLAMTRPLASLSAVDWKRTSAVALHGAIAGLCYLVSPQRFGRGPIDNPRRYDQAVEEVVAAFAEVRHPETGEPLFTEAIRVAQRIDDDPLGRCLPDVVAIPAPGFHTRVKPDRRPRLLPADPAMSGTHRVEGVLMVQSGQLPSARACTADLRDVAPLVLRLLALTPPAHMQGRSLEELWPSADSRVIPPGNRGPTDAPARAQSADWDASPVLARLRRLGYVD